MPHAAANQRVQVRYTLLEPGERAGELPAETRLVPYVVLVKGLLQQAASIGDEVLVTTASGRTIRGELVEIDPADTHTFGRPVAGLVAMSAAISRLLREGS
jgi:hypothetical protein